MGEPNPKSLANLRRGGPGRKPGIANGATRDVQAFAESVVTDPKVRAKVLSQARAGKLHPSILQLLYHYAFGKPKDVVEHSGPDGQPLAMRVVFGGRYRPPVEETTP